MHVAIPAPSSFAGTMTVTCGGLSGSACALRRRRTMCAIDRGTSAPTAAPTATVQRARRSATGCSRRRASGAKITRDPIRFPAQRRLNMIKPFLFALVASTSLAIAQDFSLTVYSTADPATFDPQQLAQQRLMQGYYGRWQIQLPGYGVVREMRPIELQGRREHHPLHRRRQRHRPDDGVVPVASPRRTRPACSSRTTSTTSSAPKDAGEVPRQERDHHAPQAQTTKRRQADPGHAARRPTARTSSSRPASEAAGDDPAAQRGHQLG